jgi:uncharacterized protein (TIGR02145 family)
MKNLTTSFISMMLLLGFLFANVACDKSEDLDGDNQSAGTIKDADGNVYKTIKIGTQTWMAENLKTTKYNDGTKITNVTDNMQWAKLKTGAYCNYNNLESNAATYGRIYNKYAVNTGMLAPVGWHVPTDDEWITLSDYVETNTGTSFSEAKALASKTNWFSSTYDGAIGNDLTKNNSTGFTAIPTGWRYEDGVFSKIGEIGESAEWWSSTPGGLHWHLYVHRSYLGATDYGSVDGYYGLSVRCVKDN